MARILVVDDDKPIRDTLRFLLEDNHHTVDEAHNGGDALVFLQTTADRFIVLLDLLMPGMDGVAVLRAVCADKRLRAQHAFLVISAGDESDIARARPLLDVLHGVIVKKPFDVDPLLEAIDAAALQLSSRK